MFVRNCCNVIFLYPKTGVSMVSRLFLSNLAKTSDNEIISKSGEVQEFDEIELNVSETISREEIELKRNKSKLTVPHQNIQNDRVPYDEPVFEYHSNVKYMKKLYGLYGNASGVDPRVCWPTIGDLSSMKEYEMLSHPHTIQEMIATCAEKKEREKEIIMHREHEIATKLAQLNRWKEELDARIKKKEAEALAAKAKKDRLIEEVRRYFGYKVDPRDERFKEMLEKKEKEEKKLAKDAKKKAREAKLIARLTSTENVEATTPS